MLTDGLEEKSAGRVLPSLSVTPPEHSAAYSEQKEIATD